MARNIYTVQVGGSVVEIEGPEGATQQELQRAATAQMGREPQRTQQHEPMVNTEALADTLKDLPRYGAQALRSAATGAGDLAVGAGQLMSHITPDFLLRPLSRAADYIAGGSGDVSGSLTDRYSGAMRQREADYQAGRDRPDLPDVGRFTGNLVAGGVAGGGASAPSLIGRMAQGGRIGTGLGLAEPIDPGQERNLSDLVTGQQQEQRGYFPRKAVQVGTSAALGFVAPPLVEGVVRAAGAAVNALSRGARGLAETLKGGSTPAAIERTLRAEMGGAGVEWNQLPQDFRSSIVAEVQKSLKAGGSIDPEAVRRLADFQRVNIQPTQGQLTRDPMQFAREQNYSKLEAGQPIAQRLTQQNQQLIGGLDDVRGNLGARATDTYSAGQNVIAGLRAQDAGRKAAVDTAYTRARNEAGIDADVPAQPVAQRIGELIENFGEDRIPGAVMARVKSFGMLGGEQTRVFNIREAEKLKTLIGNNVDNPNSPTGKALTLLKNSVDDAINSIADDTGQQAAGAFRQARGLAAQRFDTLDRAPGMADAIGRDPTAPEKFIEAHVLRGEIKDVANLLRNMRPQDRAEVRAAVLDWIRGSSVSGVEDAAKFSQAGLNRALQTIGPRKLELIFAGDREALAQLQALGRVGAYVQSPPVASGVNYSNTASTLADFADRATRLPVLNLLGRPGDVIRGQQAARAVATPSPTRQGTDLIGAGQLNTARQLAAMLAVTGAAPTSAATMDDKSKREALARALLER